MCAITAGQRGRRVAVLEHADRIGKKILISGGGRCNFTNLHCRPENFLSANPHFCKSALARYTPQDFIALVEKHRIPYHEKTLGQLFCDRSAQDIVAMLEEECRAARVEIFTATRVQEVRRSDKFVVHAGGDEFHAPALVVATGGLSIPKMGATAFGYELARQFGLKIRECRPALVPLTFDAVDRKHYCDLAGVSAEVIASVGRQQFREKMLITHRGLSGPAILQISSYWKPSRTADARPRAGDGRHRAVAAGNGRARPQRRQDSISRRATRSPRRPLARTACAAALDESRAGRIGTDRAPLEGRAFRHRRLRQGRGHRRWRRHRRAVGENHGEQATCRACTSSAKWWTSPAISAASTSSGPGPRDFAPGRRSDSRSVASIVYRSGRGSCSFFHACHNERSEGSVFSPRLNRVYCAPFRVEIPQFLSASVSLW